MGRKLSLLCGLSLLLIGAAPAGASTTVTVHVGQTGDHFTNANVTINPGDTIQWTWDAVYHSVTSGAPPGQPDGVFDSNVVTSLPNTLDHTFDHPGVYRYFCRIHYALGMVGTITVTGTDPAPTASFTVGSTTPDRGKPVSFDASASSTADGDVIDSYNWNFGDGTTASTTTPTTSHTFAASGPHTVALTVTDSGSATSATVTRLVTVKVPPDTPPTASFSFSPAQPVTGEAVRFNGSASADNDGDSVVGYRWTFGDGSTRTTSTPIVSHAYARAGSVTVGLVAVDSRGSPSASVTKRLTILAPPPRALALTVHGCLKKSKHCRHPGVHVSFILSRAAAVVVTIAHHAGGRALKHTVLSAVAGKNTVSLSARGLLAGRYVVSAKPKGGKAVADKVSLR